MLNANWKPQKACTLILRAYEARSKQCILLAGWDAGGTGHAVSAPSQKPAMQFSVAALLTGRPGGPVQAATPVGKGKGAFVMSAGPRKAPVKQPVAGFGIDSDEEE